MTNLRRNGGLADRLREATRLLHAKAERAGVMRDLLAGRVSRADYCALLENLHAIYGALEAVLSAHESNSAIAPIVDRALFRQAAIASDLCTLRGRGPLQEPVLAPAAIAYVERVETIGASRVIDVIAHAYVRYLGDLNGGQMLAPLVRTALHLDGDDGTRFYRFDGTDPSDRAQRYREALNAIPVPASTAEAIVEESVWAFEQHIALFDELAPRPR